MSGKFRIKNNRVLQGTNLCRVFHVSIAFEQFPLQRQSRRQTGPNWRGFGKTPRHRELRHSWRSRFSVWRRVFRRRKRRHFVASKREIDADA